MRSMEIELHSRRRLSPTAEASNQHEDEGGRALSGRQLPPSASEIPPWRAQVTVRGVLASAVLGTLFCTIIHRLSLTTGIIPSLNVSAGLLGFFFIKMWMYLLNKMGAHQLPFTPQENTAIQTCIVACFGVAFSGGFSTYLLAMDQRTYDLVNTSGNGHVDSLADVKNPDLGWIMAYLFSVSFLGLVALLPLRKTMIVDYKLSYPSGTATAMLINSFHTPHGFKQAQLYFDFNMTYVGAGMICPHLVNFSLLLGGVLSWALLWPLLNRHAGDWYPIESTGSDLQGLYGYKVFIAIALILGDGLYNFVKISSITIWTLHLQHRRSGYVLASTNDIGLSGRIKEVPAEEQLRNDVFLKDRLSFKVGVFGYLGLAAISIGVIPKIFHQMRWYYVLLSFGVAPILGFCNAYGCGMTDFSLISSYGKLSLFIFSSWAGRDGGVIVGLVSCGIMMVIVSSAADLMQDFKTGYLTLSSPKSMFISQLIGTFIGCIVAPLTFWIFWKAFPVGQKDGQYPAPYAVIFREMALIGQQGFSALPRHCLELSFLFFSFSVTTNVIRDRVPTNVSNFIPIPMAMALPFYIGPYFAIDMCVGSMLVFAWQAVRRSKAELYIPAVASGLMCGDGVWTLVSAILALAKVQAPVCMYFIASETYANSSLPSY